MMKVRLIRGEMYPLYTLSSIGCRSPFRSLRKAIIPSSGAEKTVKVSWLVWKFYRLVEILFVWIQDELYDLELFQDGSEDMGEE